MLCLDECVHCVECEHGKVVGGLHCERGLCECWDPGHGIRSTPPLSQQRSTHCWLGTGLSTWP